jgi:hypothetical protein
MFFYIGRRREKTLALEWGTTGFILSEPDRPEFYGTTRASPTTGESFTFFPKNKRRRFFFVSATVISVLTCVVLGLVGGIVVFKYNARTGTFGDDHWITLYGVPIGSCANAIQIQITKTIFTKLAVLLTKMENMRTDTDFVDSMVVKIFAFQFINSFASFYYIAFLSSYVENVDHEEVMYTLWINLGVIFFIRLTSGNFTEVILPYYSYKRDLKKKLNVVNDGTNQNVMMSQCEKEFHRKEYNEVMGTLEDYAELVVQYGYLTLFVVAFPIAPFLALISNFVEIRADGFKLLTYLQRAVPAEAEDIGPWNTIFKLMSGAALITNCAMVFFVTSRYWETECTNDATDEMESCQTPFSTKALYFIALQYCTFALLALFEYIVPDVPRDVAVQLERSAFLTEKMLAHITDDDKKSLIEEVLQNRNKIGAHRVIHNDDDIEGDN